MQLQLHYITQHCATLITLNCNCNYHYIALHETTLQLQLQYFTLQYTRLHYTIPRYSTQRYSTLQYTTLITPHHNYNCNCNCTTLITLHYNNYNLKLQLRHTTATTTPTTTYTTALHLQLQLQLHYTTLHPAVVVRWPLQPLQPLRKTQLQPPVGPSVDSLCHPWFTTTNLSYRFPILETSATALCGTTCRPPLILPDKWLGIHQETSGIGAQRLDPPRSALIWSTVCWCAWPTKRPSSEKNFDPSLGAQVILRWSSDDEMSPGLVI